MTDYEKARDWWQASDHDRQDSLGDGLFSVLAEYANAERNVLAAQLADARAALEDIVTGSGAFDLDNYKFACNVIQQAKDVARDALAKPAPHADLIAAEQAMAEEFAGDDLDRDRRRRILAVYRAAKEAAK